jgi:hypothetical protein
MTMQAISKTRTYPIVNVTIASNAIETVIRDSTEALGRNLGNITIPPVIAPTPNDPNSSPKPVESSPNSCLAKSGKRDNKALLHNVNKPARIINTCAA